MRPRFFCVLTAVAILASFSTGCQTASDRKAPMMKAWVTGNAPMAARGFGDFADKQCGENDKVDWHQESATTYRATGDFTNSNRHLEEAAALVDKYESDPKYSISSEFAALLTNLQNLPYKGRSYDKIMIYTYRGLNYLALGEIDKARPELNRAYQFQQAAVDENNRRIEKAREVEQSNKDSSLIKTVTTNPDFVAACQTNIIKNCEGFKFYANYVNPFTVYLDGLYFLYAGVGESDLEHARKSLNRVIEVAGSNQCVQADLQLAQNGGNNPTPTTYVIFETGQAASLTQIRFVIPIPYPGETVPYMIPAAFPKLAFHSDYAPELLIKAGEQQEKTTAIANMDAIIAQDFKNEWPVILTKTMISTMIKVGEQVAVKRATAQQQNKLGGDLMTLGLDLFNIAVTIADTRSWMTLPKEFQVARIPTPADRKIVLSTPGTSPVDVTVADGTVNIVYVKSVVANSPLSISQFKLK